LVLWENTISVVNSNNNWKMIIFFMAIVFVSKIF